MKLASRILRTVLTAAMLYASGTWAAEESAPLDCPQCGAWTLMGSQPPGVVGERMVVEAERISIPMCGDFRPSVTSSSVKTEEEGRRTYHVSLTLRGDGRGPCASKVNDIDALRMEVDVGVAHHRDGGFGSFAIIDRATGETVFAVGGWNYERDNPCHTGGAQGSLVCQTVATAELQRQLLQSALLANPNYRVGRVVRAAERACRNVGLDAGFAWPAVWQEGCKWKLLEKKLDAFTEFHECRRKKGQSCRVPDEKVARPSEDMP